MGKEMKTNVQRPTFNVQRSKREAIRKPPRFCVDHWTLNVGRWTFALISAGVSLLAPDSCRADVQRIYTAPDASAPGGIEGKVEVALIYALAINQDRVRVYQAALSDGDRGFKFRGLPTGKYDLVFLAKNKVAYEGLVLGETDFSKQPPASFKNLEDRVEKSDKFFSRYKIHRAMVDAEGEHAFAFVERLRDKDILKQSGEHLNQYLRRFEVITFQRATDTWQLREARHIYREPEPIYDPMPFFKDRYVPELGNIRIVDSVKNLGAIKLPTD